MKLKFGVTVKKVRAGKWICSGPQYPACTGEGRTRETAMAEYAQRQSEGVNR